MENQLKFDSKGGEQGPEVQVSAGYHWSVHQGGYWVQY